MADFYHWLGGRDHPGTGVSLAQEYFKIVKIGGSGTFVIDAYPVHFQPVDIFWYG